MVVCSVVGCRSSSDPGEVQPDGEKVLLYHFPKDPIMQQLWLQVIGRPKNFNTRKKYVCSKHIRPEQRVRDLRHELLNYYPKTSLKLKPDTVPTENVPFPLKIEEPPIVHIPIGVIVEQLPSNAPKTSSPAMQPVLSLQSPPSLNLLNVPGTTSTVLQPTQTLNVLNIPSKDFVGSGLLASKNSIDRDQATNIHHENDLNPPPTPECQSEASPSEHEFKTEPFDYDDFCAMNNIPQLTVPADIELKLEAGSEEQSLRIMTTGAQVMVDDDSDDVENVLPRYQVKTKSDGGANCENTATVDKSFHCEPISSSADLLLQTEIKAEAIDSDSNPLDIEMSYTQEPGVNRTNVESLQCTKNLLEGIDIARKTIQKLLENNQRLTRENNILKEENKAIQVLVENSQRLMNENHLLKEDHKTIQLLVENNQLLVSENNLLKLENNWYKQFLLKANDVNLKPNGSILGPLI